MLSILSNEFYQVYILRENCFIFNKISCALICYRSWTMRTKFTNYFVFLLALSEMVPHPASFLHRDYCQVWPDAVCVVSQRCIRVFHTWPNIRILNIYSNIRYLLFIRKYSSICFSSRCMTLRRGNHCHDKMIKLLQNQINTIYEKGK